MKLLIWCCLIAAMCTNGKDAMAVFYYGDIGPPGLNEVHIGKTAIVMPLENFLLVRNGAKYCAIKFTKIWSKNSSEVGSLFVASGADQYATCESYYIGDKTGDFSKKDIQLKINKLSFPKPRGIGRFAFSFGNKEIKCGTFKLFWSSQGAVHFYRENQDQGDYGIELAPTKWSNISEVNVFDPRLKWYRYDENRQRVNIPIERLWNDKEGGH